MIKIEYLTPLFEVHAFSDEYEQYKYTWEQTYTTCGIEIILIVQKVLWTR
jgi:hypothetical protein